MVDFTKLDCGCYVGFDVYDKPMQGKQCPLHKAAPALYEALKLAQMYIVRSELRRGISGDTITLTESAMIDALAQADDK